VVRVTGLEAKLVGGVIPLETAILYFPAGRVSKVTSPPVSGNILVVSCPGIGVLDGPVTGVSIAKKVEQFVCPVEIPTLIDPLEKQVPFVLVTVKFDILH
jgi:hypothetical protein